MEDTIEKNSFGIEIERVDENNATELEKQILTIATGLNVMISDLFELKQKFPTIYFMNETDMQSMVRCSDDNVPYATTLASTGSIFFNYDKIGNLDFRDPENQIKLISIIVEEIVHSYSTVFNVKSQDPHVQNGFIKIKCSTDTINTYLNHYEITANRTDFIRNSFRVLSVSKEDNGQSSLDAADVFPYDSFKTELLTGFIKTFIVGNLIGTIPSKGLRTLFTITDDRDGEQITYITDVNEKTIKNAIQLLLNPFNQKKFNKFAKSIKKSAGFQLLLKALRTELPYIHTGSAYVTDQNVLAIISGVTYTKQIPEN